jgi:hypothetical protein
MDGGSVAVPSVILSGFRGFFSDTETESGVLKGFQMARQSGGIVGIVEEEAVLRQNRSAELYCSA